MFYWMVILFHLFVLLLSEWLFGRQTVVDGYVDTLEEKAIIWIIYPNSSPPNKMADTFADSIFKRIFLNENGRFSIEISLKFVPKGPIDNKPALV